MTSRTNCLLLASLVFLLGGVCIAQDQSSTERVEIDAAAPASPFPHFWEQMFGSGRAILTLRESYRNDLRAVKTVTDFRYVRFHAILHDEVGVYNEDEHGNPIYNFSYVNQIYDGLLQNGVRPVVEISFMPKKLAANPDWLHPFWYKQNVSPPKDWSTWDDLMTRFAQDLVARYGIDEVAQWYFEAWNEPNIDFWGGVPRQKSYFELYDHTARALKSVSPRIRVGGPATAAAGWVDDFLAHTATEHVPVDFVSTHGYADDTVENLGIGTDESIPMDERVCRAAAKVKKQILSSSTPKLPLFWTEWNVQGMLNSRDTIFVGPALANTIRQCDGRVDMLSFWTFSDVFEENGPIPKPFGGNFGLRAKGGINKPSYYAYALLHQLGDKRLANASQDVIVTKTIGALAIAAWNLVDPDKKGSRRTIEFTFRGVNPSAHAAVQRVDAEHSNVLKRYAAIGSPPDPTPAQVQEMNRETNLGSPERLQLKDGRLELSLDENALLLLTVGE